MTLTDHVVEVTQRRLTNVYDSVEAYNAATTGVLVPYHVLVLAGFPAGFDTWPRSCSATWPATGPGPACTSWPRWTRAFRCRGGSTWPR